MTKTFSLFFFLLLISIASPVFSQAPEIEQAAATHVNGPVLIVMDRAKAEPTAKRPANASTSTVIFTGPEALLNASLKFLTADYQEQLRPLPNQIDLLAVESTKDVVAKQGKLFLNTKSALVQWALTHGDEGAIAVASAMAREYFATCKLSDCSQSDKRWAKLTAYQTQYSYLEYYHATRKYNFGGLLKAVGDSVAQLQSLP